MEFFYITAEIYLFLHTIISAYAWVEGGTDFPKIPKFSQKMLQGGQFAIVPTLVLLSGGTIFQAEGGGACTPVPPQFNV